MGNSNSYNRCKSKELKRLEKDSFISVAICSPISMAIKNGNNNCYGSVMKTDQNSFNSIQCKINKINQQISAKDDIFLKNNYTSSSYPETSTIDHYKTETISYLPLIEAIINGNPIVKPPIGYPSMITIKSNHSHSIPNGLQFSGSYISNASPFYYIGQYNSLPTYIGKNRIRYWAKPDGVYQIGQEFTEGYIEKYNGVKQNLVYNTYKCKICGEIFDCTM